MSTIQEKRHSLAHLLAQAVMNIYPDVKMTIGPSTDTGFYYDFDFGTQKVTDHDLGRIQKEMKKRERVSFLMKCKIIELRFGELHRIEPVRLSISKIAT